jgi:hypothetical protein
VRYDFLNSKPPRNYVAGLGRGATGFTTRPETGDYSARNKKYVFESFLSVSDTLLEMTLQEKHVTALDPKSRAAGSAETPWAAAGAPRAQATKI